MDPDDLIIELLSEPTSQDPYPLYHALREMAPNHPSMLGVRFVSSHAGCVELLRSHDFATGFGLAGEGFEDRPFIQKTMEILVFTNGDQHTRLRRLVGHRLLPRDGRSRRSPPRRPSSTSCSTTSPPPAEPSSSPSTPCRSRPWP